MNTLDRHATPFHAPARRPRRIWPWLLLSSAVTALGMIVLGGYPTLPARRTRPASAPSGSPAPSPPPVGTPAERLHFAYAPVVWSRTAILRHAVAAELGQSLPPWGPWEQVRILDTAAERNHAGDATHDRLDVEALGERFTLVCDAVTPPPNHPGCLVVDGEDAFARFLARARALPRPTSARQDGGA